MRVTVLGKSPVMAGRGGACSGYLVEEDDFTLLLDCGNGVFSKLRPLCDYVDVDAVLISHLHADHFLDLVPFSYALLLRAAPAARTGGRRPGHRASGSAATCTCRAGATGVFRKLVGCLGQRGPDRQRVRDPRVPRARPARRSGRSTVASARSRITPDVRGRAREQRLPVHLQRRLRPNEELVRFARDTDLLLIEARCRGPSGPACGGHLTPGEAGEHGHRARPGGWC